MVEIDRGRERSRASTLSGAEGVTVQLNCKHLRQMEKRQEYADPDGVGTRYWTERNLRLDSGVVLFGNDWDENDGDGPWRDYVDSVTQARSRHRGRPVVFTIYCLECDAPVDLEMPPEKGEILTCASCGTEMQVIGLEPTELDWVFLAPSDTSADWRW